MKRALLLLAALALAACPKVVDNGKKSGAAAHPAASRPPIRVKGSDAMKSFAAKLASEYKDANVTVEGGGSGAGFTALADGSADVAQSSRPIAAEERSAIESKRGAQVVETPAGYDVVAIYVNDANPVKELSVKQLEGIFNGTTTSWRDVGGPNAPIDVVGEADKSGFTSYLSAQPVAPKPQRDFADARGTIAAVEGDPNAIGYASYTPTTQARVVWIQRADNGMAVAPAEKTVADRSYPLSGRVYWYTVSNAPDHVKKFVEWAAKKLARTP